MKKLLTTFVLSTLLLSQSAFAETQIGGPKGGKLLENQTPRAEFFVEKDHTVSLTFYDENLKPVAVKDQSATASIDSEGKKTKIDFVKKGDLLVSNGTLPHGDGYNIVVQLKKDASSKPENFRIKYDTHICGECNRVEYACTCDE